MYENLVLSGGAVHGICYIGAVEQSELLGVDFDKINNYAGASIGSLTVAILACGGNSKFLEKILCDTDLSKIIGINWFLPVDAYHLVNEYGISTGDEFYKWLGEIFCDLTHDPDITFLELWATRNKNLVIVGTDLDSGLTKQYNYESAPMMPIRSAVRISASYPGLFTAIFDENNHVLVDGGLLDNYPIDIFDIDNINPRTLGIVLRNSNKTQHMRVIGKCNPRDYIMSLVDALYNQAMKVHIKSADWNRSIRIEVGDTSSFDFHLSAEQKADLISRGRIGVNQFFLEQKIQRPHEFLLASLNDQSQSTSV
jgi:NTE family protein